MHMYVVHRSLGEGEGSIHGMGVEFHGNDLTNLQDALYLCMYIERTYSVSRFSEAKRRSGVADDVNVS